MAIWIVKVVRKTFISTASGIVNLPEGFSVRVNSQCSCNYDAHKAALELELGEKVATISVVSDWQWIPM